MLLGSQYASQAYHASDWKGAGFILMALRFTILMHAYKNVKVEGALNCLNACLFSSYEHPICRPVFALVLRASASASYILRIESSYIKLTRIIVVALRP